jgi:hypothetical protein
MIVIEKNIGPKINYTLEKTKLTLNNEMMLDLSKYEREFDVHIDICYNQFGMLVTGLGERYVAQIDIPAREYTYEQNGTDEEGNPKCEKVPVPFDMDKVTLTLWSLEG